MNTMFSKRTLIILATTAMLASTLPSTSAQTAAAADSDFQIVEFPSEGAILRGRLYWPENQGEKQAIVIMAHGYSATINGMIADRYAEAFYKAGFAVLLYDHRNFGISGGEPRQEINIWRQARGYRDAVDYVYELPEVDRERIAIWGDSMTGGQVIAVAAIDQRVKAIVAQIPSCGDDEPREDPDGSLFASIVDTFNNANIDGTPETTMGPLPVVSHSPELYPAVMKPNTAFRWFIEYGGRFESNWKNVVTQVNVNAPVHLDPAICIPHVKAPLLMVVAEYDEMPYCSSAIAQKVYEMAPGLKELHIIGGGHFGLLYYPSPLFDESSRVQVEFLKERFGVTAH